MNRIIKEKAKQGLLLIIIVIAFASVLAVMLKYKTEGETNMPFTLKKIIVISSAEPESKAENPENYKWNLDINQYNDIYIQIQRNEENDEQTPYIQEVSIEDIVITKPTKGTPELYMPNSTEGRLFSYEENFKILSTLTYKGSQENNYKTLNVSNQGGTVLFRAVNRKISEYISNEDDEIGHDGTLLTKTNVSIDEVKFGITFDIVIKTDKHKYRGRTSLDFPCGNIVEEGASQQTIENFDNIIFKRE